MKNNDIKEIFDNAIESDTDTDINKEKIQNTVMERLGKGTSENIRFYEAEDAEKTVEPVLVTAPVKKSRKAPAVIAAAAAACLGITAISTGFFGIGSSLITSVGDTSDTAEQTDLSAAKTVQENTAAETLAQQIGAVLVTPQEDVTAEIIREPEEIPQISLVEFVGKKYPLKNNSFTLLDGTEIEVAEKNVSGTVRYETAYWLLSEDNGRVYYWNGKEKKDVTDLISMETPYIDSYENEGSGLTHYIVIWGDIASGEYGYAEMFATHERAWYFDMALNCEDDDDEEWHKEVEKILSGPIHTVIRQISGEELYKRGGGINRVYFKSVTLPCDR